jgi:hypothetical protein
MATLADPLPQPQTACSRCPLSEIYHTLVMMSVFLECLNKYTYRFDMQEALHRLDDILEPDLLAFRGHLGRQDAIMSLSSPAIPLHVC